MSRRINCFSSETEQANFLKKIADYITYEERISLVKNLQSSYHIAIKKAISDIKNLDYSSWTDDIGNKLSSHTSLLDNSYNAILNSVDNNFKTLIDEMEKLIECCNDFRNKAKADTPSSSIFDTEEDKKAWNTSYSSSGLTERGKAQLENWIRSWNNSLSNKKMDIESHERNVQNITFDEMNISSDVTYSEEDLVEVPNNNTQGANDNKENNGGATQSPNQTPENTVSNHNQVYNKNGVQAYSVTHRGGIGDGLFNIGKDILDGYIIITPTNDGNYMYSYVVATAFSDSNSSEFIGIYIETGSFMGCDRLVYSAGESGYKGYAGYEVPICLHSDKQSGYDQASVDSFISQAQKQYDQAAYGLKLYKDAYRGSKIYYSATSSFVRDSAEQAGNKHRGGTTLVGGNFYN